MVEPRVLICGARAAPWAVLKPPNEPPTTAIVAPAPKELGLAADVFANWTSPGPVTVRVVLPAMVSLPNMSIVPQAVLA